MAFRETWRALEDSSVKSIKQALEASSYPPGPFATLVDFSVIHPFVDLQNQGEGRRQRSPEESKMALEGSECPPGPVLLFLQLSPPEPTKILKKPSGSYTDRTRFCFGGMARGQEFAPPERKPGLRARTGPRWPMCSIYWSFPTPSYRPHPLSVHFAAVPRILRAMGTPARADACATTSSAAWEVAAASP